MKIAILGTKGIPNTYGGYEQFAEFISTRLVQGGHEVTVYNPHDHEFKEDSFKGVKIIRKYSPENIMGGAANIVYDYLCLKDALKKDFDIIYEAGYHSVAPSYRWLNVRKMKRPIILTNMDGLEWKRSKWSKSVQNIIKKLERIAVDESPYLISDNVGIQKYYQENFNAKSFYIPYGADPIEKFDLSHLTRWNVKQNEYFILVARMEPENNIEPIIKGHIESGTKSPLLVVGSCKTPFGQYLVKTYQHPGIQFIGGIYDKVQLDSLRHFSLGYFHGHSVGGTNPSLLEAMASQSFIIAHNNDFNKSILENSAVYFDTVLDIRNAIKNVEALSVADRALFVDQNFNRIKSFYNWDNIVKMHEDLFNDLLRAE
jgi:glycosyltransferase involved in cell wall biosynthesis